MAKAVTFGEIMLRLQPFNHLRFVQADSFEATFGGSEANVAASLASFGVEADFVTKLPEHEVGQMAVNSLRKYGVGTGRIIRGGGRVGVYYLEKGGSQRGNYCIYDRAHSAIAEAKRGEFDWDAIFADADWFHFSGITPALSPELVDICEDACRAAKERGVKISCDVNYRSQLWSKEQAREAMSRLCSYVDVCIANEEEARDVFGIETERSGDSGKPEVEMYKKISHRLAARFGFEKVAVIMREMISCSYHNWRCMLYDAASGKTSISKEYGLEIIDNIGAGDSFCAALIYTMLEEMDDKAAIEFAAAASALKYSVQGDMNLVSVSEVRKLAESDFGKK